jgi:hypothetical protein
MIMVRQHFFRATFRHAIRERQKRSSSFSISKTISKVNPGQGLSNIRRKLSMSVVGGKVSIILKCRALVYNCCGEADPT